MTSPAALDILRRTRLPFEARSTAVRGTHRQTGAVFYLWNTGRTKRPCVAVFAPGERDPFMTENFDSAITRELVLARGFKRLQQIPMQMRTCLAFTLK